MPLESIADPVARERLQTCIDEAWSRIKPLLPPDELEREHARLVFNAVWLATRRKPEGNLTEHLIARFFQP